MSRKSLTRSDSVYSSTGIGSARRAAGTALVAHTKLTNIKHFILTCTNGDFRKFNGWHQRTLFQPINLFVTLRADLPHLHSAHQVAQVCAHELQAALHDHVVLLHVGVSFAPCPLSVPRCGCSHRASARASTHTATQFTSLVSRPRAHPLAFPACLSESGSHLPRACLWHLPIPVLCLCSATSKILYSRRYASALVAISPLPMRRYPSALVAISPLPMRRYPSALVAISPLPMRRYPSALVAISPLPMLKRRYKDVA